MGKDEFQLRDSKNKLREKCLLLVKLWFLRGWMKPTANSDGAWIWVEVG